MIFQYIFYFICFGGWRPLTKNQERPSLGSSPPGPISYNYFQRGPRTVNGQKDFQIKWPTVSFQNGQRQNGQAQSSDPVLNFPGSKVFQSNLSTRIKTEEAEESREWVPIFASDGNFQANPKNRFPTIFRTTNTKNSSKQMPSSRLTVKNKWIPILKQNRYVVYTHTYIYKYYINCI